MTEPTPAAVLRAGRMNTEQALRQSLDALALRVTTSRGGYVGGGHPHATVPSDIGAVEQLAQSLAARLLDREPAAPSLEVLALLNSLGIAGPNIIHAEQGMYPDGKHSADDTWDGPGWCVCRRTWPCEALRLDTVIRLALAARLAAIPVTEEPAP